MATIALRISRGTTFLHRSSSTLASTTKPSHHKEHRKNHVYLKPAPLIGSFLEQEQPPKTPEQALAKLARLRRDYAKQVKECRLQYIDEMELQRQEKLRKDEARKQEILRLREERLKSKAVASQAQAAERKVFEENLRLTLMKEKTEKLEYWRSRQKKIEETKKSRHELICQQSSKWIDEKELEAKVLQAIVDSHVL